MRCWRRRSRRSRRSACETTAALGLSNGARCAKARSRRRRVRPEGRRRLWVKASDMAWIVIAVGVSWTCRTDQSKMVYEGGFSTEEILLPLSIKKKGVGRWRTS